MLGLSQNPSVEEAVIRLTRPEERLRWDGLMASATSSAFCALWDAGHGMLWSWGRFGLAWQAGALKYRSRDRFIGWKVAQQVERLHLVASNTRLLVLPGLPESGQLVCRRDAPPPE